jgi:hypothetical protein
MNGVEGLSYIVNWNGSDHSQFDDIKVSEITQENIERFSAA